MEEKIEIKTVKAKSFEMDYFTFGFGENILVILPGASVKSVMLSADLIAEAYKCFSEVYTVYVFDLKKNISEGYSVKDMAEDTAKALKILGINNTDIFGCSLGGMIAQCIAVNYPELVRKMILGSTISKQNKASTETCNKWIELSEKRDICLLNRDVWQRVYSKEYYQKYKSIFDSMENDGTDEELSRFNIVAKACGSFDIYNELDKIACLVFVIGSWSDNTLSGEASVEIAERLRCELYMYSGYSHAVYDEAPDYKGRILDFLT